MKTNSTQQEILVLTGTKFSTREFCKRENTSEEKAVSSNEQLMEACWNGLIAEMLPEICTRTSNGQKLWLWHVRETNSFIELDLCETPIDKEKYSSINPYNFLPEQCMS